MSITVPLGGAAQRLLHPGVPVLFFGTATITHIIAWVLLAMAAPDVVGGWGGPGPALAALHALAVGVVLMTVVGASLQILPVVTMQSAPPAWFGVTLFALLGSGGALLIGGFITLRPVLLHAGATLTALGALGYVAQAALLAWRARRSGLRDTLVALAGGLAFLVLVLGMAVLLATGQAAAWGLDHLALARSHGLLALFGFMGFLVVGFSVILLPMLGIATPPPPGSQTWVLVLGGAAVLVAAAGFGGVGGLLGLISVGLHVRVMRAVLAQRMRRRLGPEFHLFHLSWAMLAASLVLAVAIAWDLAPERLRALALLLALHGWLLSLLMGVLQRILPFLASMHTVSTCVRPASVTTLTWSPPLRIHLAAHCAALVLAAAGIAVEAPVLVIAAGAAGAAAAAAFATFAVSVFARTVAHARAVGLKEKTP